MGDERNDDDDPVLAKKRAEERMTDGGIFIVGDEVIHDGEAARYGGKPKTKVRPRSTWPDTEE